MPRYKPVDTGMKLLPIDLSVQLLPGTFEHALSHLVDQELDLSPLDKHFRNDESGAPAYAPSVMLKVILYAYSRGMIRSRDIATVCQENGRESFVMWKIVLLATTRLWCSKWFWTLNQ